MSRSMRKWEHIQHALNSGQERLSGFEDITFVHQSLPNSSMDQVTLNTKIGELLLSSPIFINAMTGGGGEKTEEINRNLAIAANVCNIALAVGSQMSGLKRSIEENTYKIIRKENPNGVVIGNLGSEATVEQAKRAVDMIEANALQIHLNTIQELTMPEGDRVFTDALTRIEAISHALHVPVIVKEVGFGMGIETVRKLASVGVSAIDIGGFGGTNFAQIENMRRKKTLPFFQEWGIPTTVSLIEANEYANGTCIIASGGIQSSMDLAKSLALGANAAGMAGSLLKTLINEGVEALIDLIKEIEKELMIIMTALGASKIKELHHTPLIVSGNTHHWVTERGIDTKKYSSRSRK